MSEKQYYTAIDLGTTNSVIAYGNMQNNTMKPIVLELDRKNDTGSKSRNPLLPSVVFYYKNSDGKMTADIGDYAKSRYGTRSGYVCKSVKSLMGTSDQVPLVDEIPDKTPSDVSAQILSFMINSAKKRLFQNELSDVIITVPASFDSDQCQATLDAAPDQPDIGRSVCGTGHYFCRRIHVGDGNDPADHQPEILSDVIFPVPEISA